MLRPRVAARVKERRSQTASGIDRVRRGVFMAVAALAGERQIVGLVTTALCEGNDVFDREGVGGKAQLTEAIFAAVMGALGDCLLQSR